MKNLYKSIRGEIFNLSIYFVKLKVGFLTPVSVLGFLIFVIILMQIASGIMLALGYLPETMLIPNVREEEDCENLYTDDFFWLHERGVDFLVLLLFFHFFRKLYLNIHGIEQETAWKSGVFIFLVTQVAIFAGLVLCDTHLSDITLVIACNALHTFFLFIGKFYWLIFPGKSLNSDTIMRVTYLHYIITFFLCYLGCVHGVDMHYDWKPKAMYSGIKQQMNWWDEVLINEIGKLKDIIIITCLCSELLYIEPESLNYEIFMWGDVGMVVDVRFYGVAPHWYFRPYMAWLIACPYHYIGIFGLMFFFLVIYFQSTIVGMSPLQQYRNLRFNAQIFKNKNITNFLIRYNIHLNYKSNWSLYNPNLHFYWELSFGVFIISILYTMSFLPYGRFYNKIGGNVALLFSYFYIFSYLTFVNLRYSYNMSSYRLTLHN